MLKNFLIFRFWLNLIQRPVFVYKTTFRKDNKLTGQIFILILLFQGRIFYH